MKSRRLRQAIIAEKPTECKRATTLKEPMLSKRAIQKKKPKNCERAKTIEKPISVKRAKAIKEPKRLERKPPKGRGRGHNYERIISRALSLWVTGGERDDCYWRSSGSGGRFSRGKASSYASGDITCEHPIGQELLEVFNIETKRYDKLDLFDLIEPYKKRKKGNPIPNDIKQFWDQCERDAKLAGKNPWLIMKRNFYLDYMIMGLEFMKATKLSFPYVAWKGNFICKLGDFFESTDPKVLVAIKKRFGE